jgi:hypothetical protein
MVTVADARTLELEGEATIHGGAELRAELEAALPSLPGAFVVRTERLEALDLVGAQLLLAVRRSRPAGAVTFAGWPPAVADFLRGSGLETHFA